jgi:hypothetical protein
MLLGMLVEYWDLLEVFSGECDTSCPLTSLYHPLTRVPKRRISWAFYVSLQGTRERQEIVARTRVERCAPRISLGKR